MSVVTKLRHRTASGPDAPASKVGSALVTEMKAVVAAKKACRRRSYERRQSGGSERFQSFSERKGLDAIGTLREAQQLAQNATHSAHAVAIAAPSG